MTDTKQKKGTNFLLWLYVVLFLIVTTGWMPIWFGGNGDAVCLWEELPFVPVSIVLAFVCLFMPGQIDWGGFIFPVLFLIPYVAIGWLLHIPVAIIINRKKQRNAEPNVAPLLVTRNRVSRRENTDVMKNGEGS